MADVIGTHPTVERSPYRRMIVITKTLPGKSIRYWDFNRTVEVEENGTRVQKPEPGWTVKESDIEVTFPENIAELMNFANQPNGEARLLEVFVKGLTAEAEEKAGTAPEGTFSKAMVSAVDRALQFNPEFAAIKGVADRKAAEMRWLGKNPAMRDAFYMAFLSLNTVAAEKAEETTEEK
jgi:hypothetical protein